jgi:hypothetical protein
MIDGSLIPQIKSNREIYKTNPEDDFTTSIMRFVRLYLLRLTQLFKL